MAILLHLVNPLTGIVIAVLTFVFGIVSSIVAYVCKHFPSPKLSVTIAFSTFFGIIMFVSLLMYVPPEELPYSRSILRDVPPALGILFLCVSIFLHVSSIILVRRHVDE